jgi:hypothetical protein
MVDVLGMTLNCPFLILQDLYKFFLETDISFEIS